jgi:hypothetical protein
MSTVNNGPQIVRNGLVLNLDASTRGSYLPNSLINMNNWVVGTGGVANYNPNGNPATENQRFAAANPWGHTGIIWGSFPSGNGNDDGGWNTTDFNIDNTKLYRFSVWVKRTSVTTGGTFYFGMNANGDGPRQMDNNTVNTNPYWSCIGTSGLTQDVWYLYVAHVYPWNTSYTGRHPDTGYYFVNNPIKQGDVNGCNIGSGDLKWSSNSTIGIHRTYHYYCTDSTTRLQFYDPRVDLVDGKQPSINELVNKSPVQWMDLSGNSNNTTLINGPTYSTNNKGIIVFDGVDDYGSITNASSLRPINELTIELVIKAVTTTAGWNHIFGINPYTSLSPLIFLETGGQLIRALHFVDGVEYRCNTNETISTSVFKHVVFTFKPGDAIRSYFNGVASTTTSLPNGTLSYNTSIAFLIGYSGANWPNIQYGLIRMYNKALTQAEVSQNFQATKTRFGL